MLTVGVPRALLYYDYFPLWHAFFTHLGVKTVVSSPTTKATLDSGVLAAVDETCLPVKVFYGHFLELVDTCDLIFLPRLVSVEPRTYICPKFMGLPDLLRSLGYRNLLDPVIDLRDPRRYLHNLWAAAMTTAQSVGVGSAVQVGRALWAGIKAQRTYRSQLCQGLMPSELLSKPKVAPAKADGARTIGLIGHPYTLFDEVINLNLLTFLRAHGYRILTPVHYRVQLLTQYARSLPKELFWSYGRRMVGAALLWSKYHLVDGIIHLETFGCGTDSITGELIERLIRRSGQLPYLLVTIDEHSGEAGIRTRLEAFCDMIEFNAIKGAVEG
ncbi:MAG: hypothetical protein GX058_07825 [Firmicutes bacterium]|nr:hypothetical protein [Bacillota bacterium]